MRLRLHAPAICRELTSYRKKAADKLIKLWDADTGDIIRTLEGHTEGISDVAWSANGDFLASASDDKTVKVWDTARLERNVTSKPRHTYNQHHARVKCVCMLEGVHCFASAAEDGSLHIVRVHVTQGGTLPKYSKLHTVREHRVETTGEYITSMTHYGTGMITRSFTILLVFANCVSTDT